MRATGGGNRNLANLAMTHRLRHRSAAADDRFYLTLYVVRKELSGAVPWRLFGDTLVSLALGHMCQIGLMSAWLGSDVNMAGRLSFLFEILVGKLGTKC